MNKGRQMYHFDKFDEPIFIFRFRSYYYFFFRLLIKMNQFNLLHDKFHEFRSPNTQFLDLFQWQMKWRICFVCASVLNKKLIYWKLIRIN